MNQLFAVSALDVANTSDEWYTPRWIFDAAGLTFDMDVCAPVAPEFRTCPARRYLTVLDDGLTAPWDGLVWMNPPYSNIMPWAERFARHGEGLALVPTVNSSWRIPLMRAADGIALVSVSTKLGRSAIRSQVSTGFRRPDGSEVGFRFALVLAACGEVAVEVLSRVAAADPYSGGAYHVRPAP